MILENDITRDIIRAAIEVHRVLGGPGLLESVYKGALAWELGHAGHKVEREVPVPVVYKGVTLSDPLRIDLLVDRKIVVEAKAAARNNPAFSVQCNTYLRLAGYRIGLVINFGLPRLMDGVERVANKALFAPGELSNNKVDHEVNSFSNVCAHWPTSNERREADIVASGFRQDSGFL